MYVPFVGYAPDADATTPGVLVSVTNMVPTERGLAGAPGAAEAVTGLAALASDCRGAAALVNTLGIRRNIAGTQTKLYEISGSTWADVSRVGDYTGSSENRWMFAQFGNAALASNDTEVIQASTSGAFADIATAPKARIIVAAKDFVLAFNTNDGTYGDSPDRWWCSQFQDHSTWTISVPNQANTGRLVGAQGEITAAANLGALVVAYKARGMYLGQYVGSPIVWQWDQVPGEVGCVGPEAVVDIGGAHIFIGEDNIWQFDGTRPIPIATGVIRQAFFDDGSATYRYRAMVNYDRQKSLVWIFYASSNSTTGIADRAIVYNLVSKTWGRADMTAQAVVNFIVPGITWDTLDTVATTWETLPDLPWDSQAWQAGGRALAVFNASNQLRTLTGSSTGGSITTGDYGSDAQVSYSPEVRLRYLTAPTSATATGYTRQVMGGALTTNSTVTQADGKLDIRQSGRWHRYSVTFTGGVEVTGIDLKMQAAGAR